VVLLRRIGFFVNPIAGIGGRAGFKGSDDPRLVEKALKMGFTSPAPDRAMRVFEGLLPLADRVKVFAYAGKMGSKILERIGFPHEVVGEEKDKTTAEDTVKACQMFKSLKVDLIVFCGGDGTARDVCSAIGTEVPALGIPSGVKMYSSVFAKDLDAATRLLKAFLEQDLPLREAEVVDVDEERFRRDKLSIKLYGYLLVPYEPELVQLSKSIIQEDADEAENKRAIARYIVEQMERDVLYILGPGSTVKAITDELGQPKTLLGVDLMVNGKVVARDVSEKEILSFLDAYDKAKVVVTVIGRQGHIFGRGNQQISPAVLRKVGLDNVIIIATRRKIKETPVLHVDTGDEELDASFKPYVRVLVDYNHELVVPVR